MIKNGWIRDVDGEWFPMSSIKRFYVEKGRVLANSNDFCCPIIIWEPFPDTESDDFDAMDFLDKMMGVDE